MFKKGPIRSQRISEQKRRNFLIHSVCDRQPSWYLCHEQHLWNPMIFTKGPAETAAATPTALQHAAGISSTSGGAGGGSPHNNPTSEDSEQFRVAGGKWRQSPGDQATSQGRSGPARKRTPARWLRRLRPPRGVLRGCDNDGDDHRCSDNCTQHSAFN